MKLSDKVCSYEQAKRLYELGVRCKSQWSVSMYDNDNISTVTATPICDEKILNFQKKAFGLEYYSAYDTAELGVILGDRNNPYNLEYTECSCDKYEFIYYKRNEYGERIIFADTYPTEAQARAAMLIYLLESDIVTPEEINKR